METTLATITLSRGKLLMFTAGAEDRLHYWVIRSAISYCQYVERISYRYQVTDEAFHSNS